MEFKELSEEEVRKAQEKYNLLVDIFDLQNEDLRKINVLALANILIRRPGFHSEVDLTIDYLKGRVLGDYEDLGVPSYVG